MSALLLTDFIRCSRASGLASSIRCVGGVVCVYKHLHTHTHAVSFFQEDSQWLDFRRHSSVVPRLLSSPSPLSLSSSIFSLSSSLLLSSPPRLFYLLFFSSSLLISSPALIFYLFFLSSPPSSLSLSSSLLLTSPSTCIQMADIQMADAGLLPSINKIKLMVCDGSGNTDAK